MNIVGWISPNVSCSVLVFSMWPYKICLFSWYKHSGFIYCHHQIDGWNMFIKQFPSSKTENQSFQMNILNITWNWPKSNRLISEPTQGLRKNRVLLRRKGGRCVCGCDWSSDMKKWWPGLAERQVRPGSRPRMHALGESREHGWCSRQLPSTAAEASRPSPSKKQLVMSPVWMIPFALLEKGVKGLEQLYTWDFFRVDLVMFLKKKEILVTLYWSKVLFVSLLCPANWSLPTRSENL